MAAHRVYLAAGGLVLATTLLAPVTCSQSSDDTHPRCDTVLGYETPFGEWVQGVLLVAVVLCVVGSFRRRTG